MAKRGGLKLAAAMAMAFAPMVYGSTAQATVGPVYPSPTPRPSGTPLPPTGTTTTFNFTGTCTDCTAQFSLGNTPSTTVTGQLVLAGYTLGQAIDFTNFVSFTYSGSNIIPGGFTIYSTSASALGGAISTVPGADGFYVSGLQYPDYFFESSTSGAWNIGQQYYYTLDTGNSGSYSQAGSVAGVPEPMTWLLLTLGIGAIGARARYRRRTATLARA